MAPLESCGVMAEGLPRAESIIRASSGTTKAAATVLPELAEGAAPWHGPVGLLPRGVSRGSEPPPAESCQI